jgi:hypothetical protein
MISYSGEHELNQQRLVRILSCKEDIKKNDKRKPAGAGWKLVLGEGRDSVSLNQLARASAPNQKPMPSWNGEGLTD